MNSFNDDEVFRSILTGIDKGDIKTTYHLRTTLEVLREKFNIKELLILAMFREWLAKRNFNLTTEYGTVMILPIDIKV